MVVLDWDQTFSLQGNILTPGYQRTVLSGMITEQRADGLYAAPLLPQLFYGASGSQLSTWRQNIPTTGSITLLSRSGGQPSIPKDQLAWRKVSDVPKPPQRVETVEPSTIPSSMMYITLLLMGTFITTILIFGGPKDEYPLDEP